MTQIPIIPSFQQGMTIRPSSSTPDPGGSAFADLVEGIEKSRPADNPLTDVSQKAEDVLKTLEDIVEDMPVEDVPDVEDAAAAETGEALAGLIEALKQVQTVAQQGGTPDGAQLEALNAAIDKLAGLLGIDLTQAASPEELKALTMQVAVEGEPIQSQLQRALAPLAGQMQSQTDMPDLAALGDKLGALIKGMGAVDQAALQSVRAEIEAAVGLLPKPAGILRQEAAAPEVATPALAEPASLAAAEVPMGKPVLNASEATGKGATASAEASTGTGASPTNESKPDLRAPNTELSANRAAPDTQTTLVQATPEQAAKVDTSLAAPRPVIAGYQTSQQQINLPQIAFEMARQVTDGRTQFQIRLDPAELGRVDVRLDIDQSGQVTARLMVERSETLDLMQRDQRGLEKALQQAGLDGSKTNLEFSLKQQGSGQGSDGREGSVRPGFGGQGGGSDGDEGQVPTVNLYRGKLSASGVNIFA